MTTSAATGNDRCLPPTPGIPALNRLPMTKFREGYSSVGSKPPGAYKPNSGQQTGRRLRQVGPGQNLTVERRSRSATAGGGPYSTDRSGERSSAHAFVSVLEGIQFAAERQSVEYGPGRPDSLWTFFKTVEFWQGDTLLTPVLILDQFEELFTLHARDATMAFLADLGTWSAACARPRLGRRILR